MFYLFHLDPLNIAAIGLVRMSVIIQDTTENACLQGINGKMQRGGPQAASLFRLER